MEMMPANARWQSERRKNRERSLFPRRRSNR
jgi:hypothetical protein